MTVLPKAKLYPLLPGDVSLSDDHRSFCARNYLYGACKVAVSLVPDDCQAPDELEELRNLIGNLQRAEAALLEAREQEAAQDKGGVAVQLTEDAEVEQEAQANTEEEPPSPLSQNKLRGHR